MSKKSEMAAMKYLADKKPDQYRFHIDRNPTTVKYVLERRLDDTVFWSVVHTVNLQFRY